MAALHLLLVARPWRAICRRRVSAASGSVVVGYAVLLAKQHLRINGDSETAHLLYMLISLSRLSIEAQSKATSQKLRASTPSRALG